MKSLDEVKQRMARAAEIKDMLGRRVFVLAIVTDCLSELGVRLVLADDGFVQLYVLDGEAAHVDNVLGNFGFQNRGCYWIRADIDVIIQMPSSPPGSDLCSEKEKILVELDKARWARYIETGKIEILGPRKWKWRIDNKKG